MIEPVPGVPGIHVGSLDGAAPIRLLADTSRAVYVPPRTGARTGAVLFTREATVMALPFDAGHSERRAAPTPVSQDVSQGAGLAVTEHSPHQTPACCCIAVAATLRLKSRLARPIRQADRLDGHAG